MELQDRIKHFRKEAGLSRVALGKLINKSSETIKKYESGEIDIKWGVIVEISKALGVNILRLLPITNDAFIEELHRREELYFDVFGG